jgi:hypothetical protein
MNQRKSGMGEREKSRIISATKTKYSWALWLMPVILATQEVKIRRITVRSQLGQITHDT